MEAFLGDTEESTEDSPGHKKSKLKSLKTRLFGKNKKAGETSCRKLSQSATDVTADEELGSNEDLLCNQGGMGSRALSHDSIFLADQALTAEAEPTRVLSQENVHSKIKALQDKLQQQKFHLGPPPVVPPVKRSEDETSRSEEDVHDRSEMAERHSATLDNLNKVLSQMSSNPVLPIPAQTKPAPLKATSPMDEAPLDFSAPAQFTSSLDTSAARHRLSIKPRNQRASTKKRQCTVDSTALTSDLTNTETLKEEEECQTNIQEEPESEMVDSKPNETTSVLSEPTQAETTSKTPGIVSSQQDPAIVGKMPSMTAQILRPKSHRAADAMPRPHSSFIPSEVRGKCESSGNFDIQFLRDTQNKSWAADMKTKIASADPKSAGPGQALRSTVVPDEIGRTAAIKRPLPGSGSFHLSVSASKRKEEEERPRSGSFTGVREHARIKIGEKRLDASSPNSSPKVDLKPCGAPLNLGKEETWAIKDSLRKVDSVRQPKNKTIDTGEAETAPEVKEEERKSTFGVKLRSTSQSVRLRAETSPHECSRPTGTEEKKQDTSDNADQMSKKTACTTEETKPDVSPAPPAASVPTKQTPFPPVNPPLGSAEAQPSQEKGVPPAPQGPQLNATSTEVSWMSMAMEKTKSLHNLFTSKFPRDLTGGQTAACSQKTQGQALNQADTQTQDVKSANQTITDTTKTEAQQHKSPAQTVKQSLPATTAQQSAPKASAFKEAQTKPTVSQPIPTVTQSSSQGNIWTSQSPLRSVRQVESIHSSPHSTPQQPPWSTRSLKSTGFVVTPSSQDTVSECSTSAANVEETEEQVVWSRSVSKRAAFLEKRSEGTSPPVELKKYNTTTTSETSAQSEDTKASVDSESKHTESSSTKNPERPKEEKWIRKPVDPCSAPSPSSTPSSSLQSLSDSGELSWIELAKRKSMAWSDKTMD